MRKCAAETCKLDRHEVRGTFPQVREVRTDRHPCGMDAGRAAAATRAGRQPHRARSHSTGRVARSAHGRVNPLTEIVEIHGNLKQGTGTFLAGCRIITAYHVLLAIRHPLDVDRLDAFMDENLVGQWFEFETRPLASTKQVAMAAM